MKRPQNPPAEFAPAYLAAKEKVIAEKISTKPIPKRKGSEHHAERNLTR